MLPIWDLKPVRADSAVLSEFIGVAKSLECEVSCEPEDVTLEIELPATWDDFLGKLTGKQRHEVRRNSGDYTRPLKSTIGLWRMSKESRMKWTLS